jgi:2,3-dihydroxybiphenyl 1,2-dioxygenase
MNVELELAYLGVEVADPTGFGTFLADVVGLVPGDTTTDGAPAWRNDDRAQRIIVQEGPADDAIFIGFEAVSADAFDRAVDRARDAGETVTDGTAADLAARRVERLVRVEAPWGVPVEIVHGLAAAGEAFASPLVPGGFLTKGQGFGHVVFLTTDLDGADRFAREVIGLEQSDWMETDLGGIPLTVRFYHCNPRHHSLALGSLPIELPQKLHHVMLASSSSSATARGRSTSRGPRTVATTGSASGATSRSSRRSTREGESHDELEADTAGTAGTAGHVRP